MSDDLRKQLAATMRERRAAERHETLKALEGLQGDIARLRREADLLQETRDRVILGYVVERLSKRDYDGLQIFQNQLPPDLRQEVDRCKELYEAVHGRPPSI